MSRFSLVSDYQPTGDQPAAIDQLLTGLNQGLKHQVLLGATGTGKTFTVANVIAQSQKPTLVLAHNKTLAAQLYGEFKAFFPDNAVGYFVSYFDYYQPEAYKPQSDTYIEKDSAINYEIDRLRHQATANLLSRRDVVIVASVSAIFGLGSVANYNLFKIDLTVGRTVILDKLLRQLTNSQYQRNDQAPGRGCFRLKGDTLDVYPADSELIYRVEFFGDQIERLRILDGFSRSVLEPSIESLAIYPASHYVTPEDQLKKALVQIRQELDKRLAVLKDQDRLIEGQRLRQRVEHDLELLAQTGFVKGIENYSLYLSQRQPGDTPATLFDYFPDDFLLLVDESHMTIPQIQGMSRADRNRKQTLVDYGFRLPSALDNRPLDFAEFQAASNQVIYISATPADYELQQSPEPARQIIRPTGLLDPQISVRPISGQIDDLVDAIKDRLSRSERVLVTTLTKRMAEDLTDYLKRLSIRVTYLHSEIDTLERSEILADLRSGSYDVLVGINLLREGLDLPEVSLVAILDADKEGFLRSGTTLIQTIGRAARHPDGLVIMYADQTTASMAQAITETNRRRDYQIKYNRRHNIKPAPLIKKPTDRYLPASRKTQTDPGRIKPDQLSPEMLEQSIVKLEAKMKLSAANLDFEKAAWCRDRLKVLQKARRKNKPG